jgi:hypothetical protein
VIVGVIPPGLGWSLFLRDVLTIWVGQNMKKEVFPEFKMNLNGLPMTGN